MMQATTPVTPGSASTPTNTTSQTSTQRTATNAFGVGFEDLLRIILTQLTYQDPLKPIENYEFVSQLAQFSQIQQTETGNERLQGILQSQSTMQAASLLGRRVDIPSGSGVLTGRVVSVSFINGAASLTIETSNPTTTIGNIAITSVSRIAEER
jgi:flagellar basal-body rod modification protein FlgD